MSAQLHSLAILHIQAILRVFSSVELLENGAPRGQLQRCHGHMTIVIRACQCVPRQLWLTQ